MSNQREYWNKRYKAYGMAGSGTFIHSALANEWFYKAKFHRLKNVLTLCDVKVENACVLDAACGSGRFVPFFDSLGAREIVGFDISDVAVQLCLDKYSGSRNASFYCIDLTTGLPAGFRNRFNVVCMFEAIFLITEPVAFEKALRGLAQAVAPGGALVISDHFPTKTQHPTDRVVYNSSKKYESILSSEGLVIQEKYTQTILFNRSIFPKPVQSIIENRIPWLIYYIDRFLLRTMPNSFFNSSSIYYCVAKRRG